MLNYLRKILNNQVGFTAVELLIGVALIGIIGGAIGVTVAQTYSGSSLSSKQMTAINNVKNAGDWLTRDAEQARPKESIPGSVELLSTAIPPNDKMTLIWYDYKNDNYSIKEWYRVIYTIPSGTTNLQRTFEIGTYSSGSFTPDPNQPSQSIIVARNITGVTRQFKDCVWSSDPNPICQQVINALTITITSTVGSVTERRTFEIEFRPTK